MLFRERRGVAFNLAGHAVIAEIGGLRILSVFLAPTEEASYVQNLSPIYGSRSPRSPAMKRALDQMMVGPIAGELARRCVWQNPDQYRRWQNSEPYESSWSRAWSRLGDADLNEVRLHLTTLEAQALDCLVDNWRHVSLVAMALLERGYLSANDFTVLRQGNVRTRPDGHIVDKLRRTGPLFED